MQTFVLLFALAFAPLAEAAMPKAGIARNHDGRELGAAEEAAAAERAREDLAIRLAVGGKYDEADAVRLQLVDGQNPFIVPAPGQAVPVLPGAQLPARPPVAAAPCCVPPPPPCCVRPAPPAVIYQPVVPVVPTYYLSPVLPQPVLLYPYVPQITAYVVTPPPAVAIRPLQPTLPPPVPQGFIIIERNQGEPAMGRYCYANGEAFQMAIQGQLNALCYVDNSTFGGYVGYGRVIP